MEAERALRLMVQVCGALEEAHRAGIVHRDLKPENIFLTLQGGTTDFPKVLDFGLAKMSEKQMGHGSMMLTQEGMVFGTPEFMSPEQAQGEPLDHRSDIYSLALILYELITGKLPFDAKTPLDIMKAHVRDAPIPLSQRVPGQAVLARARGGDQQGAREEAGRSLSDGRGLLGGIARLSARRVRGLGGRVRAALLRRAVWRPSARSRVHRRSPARTSACRRPPRSRSCRPRGRPRCSSGC